MMSYLNNGYGVMNCFAKFKKFLPHSINMPSFMTVRGKTFRPPATHTGWSRYSMHNRVEIAYKCSGVPLHSASAPGVGPKI